ncbi:FixH family protein [Amycolatopsis solani]|uniref:FixH family protein n=1 Tax=Amycolatopsis solani TaxID=3028615 RepID=UPI00296FFAA8|nr:FixH family protein [Amycolatopsis sp. MEP2-6]
MKRPTVLIAAVAVVAAGLLTWLLWPGGGAKPTTQQAVSGPYTVQFSADRPRIGGNTFAVAVTGPAPEAVTVAPVMAQMGHALAPVPAGPDGPGRFRAADVGLPMAGQWEITVSLRGPGGAAQVVFPLLVN